MGKAGRAACILTPLILTLASFICLVLIEIAGWNKGLLPSYYMIKFNTTELDLSSAIAGVTSGLGGDLPGGVPTAIPSNLPSAIPSGIKSQLPSGIQSNLPSAIPTGLRAVKKRADIPTSISSILGPLVQEIESEVADIYAVHLWNYCSSDKPSGVIDYCSPRQKDFYFNPLEVFAQKLKGTATTTGGATSVTTNAAVQSLINADPALATEAAALSSTISSDLGGIENSILPSGAKDALDAYQKASKAMFILYAISFWTTLATLGASIFAVCSRWGSFCTWIFSAVSSILNLAAVGLMTGIFITLTHTLSPLLTPYNVTVTQGHNVLVAGWLGVVFSFAATLFWLFSVCCCSGRSNPHHRSNKGGLWNAEPKGQGYSASDTGRGRSLFGGEKDYTRVESPFLERSRSEDGVAMTSYPQQTAYTGHAVGHHEDDEGDFESSWPPQRPAYTGQHHSQDVFGDDGHMQQNPYGGGYEPYRRVEHY